MFVQKLHDLAVRLRRDIRIDLASESVNPIGNGYELVFDPFRGQFLVHLHRQRVGDVSILGSVN